MYNRKIRQERQEMLSTARQELYDTRCSLDSAYKVFNAVSDPNLIEASVLEISALQSKYNNMIKNYKAISEV